MTDDRTPVQRPRERLLPAIAIPVGLLAAIGIVLWTFSRVLLRVEPHAATVTALLVAITIVAIFSYAASRKRVSNGSLLTAVVGVFGVAMLFSGAALLVGQETGGTGPTAVTVALAAPSGAAISGYDHTSLSAPADTPLTIAFDNQDPGVQHNVMITSADPAKDPGASTLLDGELVTGPQQFDYSVQALPAATYYYFCKVHPATMHGRLTVAAGATPGASGSGGAPSGSSSPAAGGVTVVAQNLAFNTTAISLPANTASTITFDNQDGGTTHNIAIYADDSYRTAVFTGPQVIGVATLDYAVPALAPGTYAFRCDFHPTTMTGTVTVG